jgi:hypothetical protein
MGAVIGRVVRVRDGMDMCSVQIGVLRALRGAKIDEAWELVVKVLYADKEGQILRLRGAVGSSMAA